ncbi:hypothetical protein B551_0222910 [Cupriavidus sp. HPC(L)]|nr:hypothetical protein B551_0222910 [Cupriavidus sp. HPC(L)]
MAAGLMSSRSVLSPMPPATMCADARAPVRDRGFIAQMPRI